MLFSLTHSTTLFSKKVHQKRKCSTPKLNFDLYNLVPIVTSRKSFSDRSTRWC